MRSDELEGLNVVGVPVKESDSDVIGALSVSGPTHRLKVGRLTDGLPDLC